MKNDTAVSDKSLGEPFYAREQISVVRYLLDRLYPWLALVGPAATIIAGLLLRRRLRGEPDTVLTTALIIAAGIVVIFVVGELWSFLIKARDRNGDVKIRLSISVDDAEAKLGQSVDPLPEDMSVVGMPRPTASMQQTAYLHVPQGGEPPSLSWPSRSGYSVQLDGVESVRVRSTRRGLISSVEIANNKGTHRFVAFGRYRETQNSAGLTG